MPHDETVRPNLNGHQQAEAPTQPDPEVVPKAERRRYPTEYKLRILAEADACTQPGQIGALLRREGLYRSLLDKWRKQRRGGRLQALASHRRGPKVDPLTVENAQLRRENERLQKRLPQGEPILQAQKKLSMMLGLTMDETANGAQP